MIERCIEKLRQDACGGCDRRHACAFHWTPGDAGARSPGRKAKIRDRRSSFLALLGDIAKVIEGHARASRAPYSKEVERRLEPMLASGEVSVARVAREMGCSRQTLYRRLKAEGATFAEVLDQLRRRIARQLLREERLSVKEAAYRLGFSDPAAFSRAFKRWTGTAPSGARSV